MSNIDALKGGKGETTWVQDELSKMCQSIHGLVPTSRIQPMKREKMCEKDGDNGRFVE